MEPRFLFHGSCVDVSGSMLLPSKPGDITHPDNSLFAVYATCDERIARTLSFVSHVPSYGNFLCRPFVVACVSDAFPLEGFVYKVDAKCFEERPKGSKQWVSLRPVKILEKKKVSLSEVEGCIERVSEVFHNAECFVRI